MDKKITLPPESVSTPVDTDQLVAQLKLLNKQLDSINFSKGRFFVYNANLLKFALYNFWAGIFHSLGALFGTVVIAALIIYFVSQIDIVNPITNWLEQIITQINWNKIITPLNSSTLDINQIKIEPNLLQQIQP